MSTTQPQIGTSTWVIDPVHSSVEFSVKHMMVATAKGRFTKWLRQELDGGWREQPCSDSVTALAVA